MESSISVDKVHMHLENKKVSRNFFWMLWIMYAVVYMTKNCYSAAMASIVYEGVLTKSQTGLISAAFYFVYAPLQVVGGLFADKYNPERMIKIGLVGSGIANLIIFCNQNYYVMLCAWIFNAVVQFAIYPALFKIISSQLEAEYRLKGVYFITFSSTFGLVLAYLVAAVVTKWQFNFALSAIFLFLFTIIFHIVCKQVERHMVPDTTPKPETESLQNKKTEQGISAWRLFVSSGFIMLIVVTAFRTIISNCIQTMSSTMLMESYEHISPSLGNMLNTLIIISGIVGLILVNRFIYPRPIRDEVLAMLMLMGLSMVPLIILVFLGKVPVVVIVISLCVSSALFNGISLLMSRCCAAFVKHGKNGLASGVNNASSAFAFTIQNYGILLLVDYVGWKTVTWLWVVLLVVCIMLSGIAFPMWKRFREKRG